MSEEARIRGIVSCPFAAVVKSGLRSIAASFPGFASLGQLWNEYETGRTNKRIEELFNNLAAELERLRERIPADGIRGCDNFPELLEITIDKVRREYGEPKRAAYARLLAKLVVEGDQRSHDEKVALLDSLDVLSGMDLRVLSLFAAKQEAEIGDLRWRNLALPGDANEQLWEMSCSLAKLESRGLILKVSTHTGAVYVQAPLNSDATRWEKTKYRVLPLGRSLIALLFG